MRLAVPRDRDGSFVPALVPKQATRSDGLNAVIISLYAKGMSVRDIARHVRQTAGVDLSPDTISRVTDARAGGRCANGSTGRWSRSTRSSTSTRWSRRSATGRRCGTRR